MSGTETPSEGQLLFEASRYVVGRLNVCTPARVVRYDSGTGYADVQPDLALRVRIPDTDEVRHVPVPVVEEVPVVWPVWGGRQIGIVGQLQAGDRVTLVISDKSLDEWKQAASQPIERLDSRRCQITDAMALVGGYPGSEGPPQATAGALVVQGQDVRLGGDQASDPVVTESRLLGELAKLVAAFNAHTHVYSPGPSAPAPTAPPAAPQQNPIAGSTSSPNVKAT